ncbi:heart- and neural crest derivatives-expressed protein 1-like [Sardina pilchardus]|uniref:heart- and neural crest derivatives-expressed protein 1-like n=1 Tax=Sardina pilchardus TaxID=27697 RepID=UPI002E116428
MNLIGSYHHHHIMHETFSLAQRCHQDNPYLRSWLNNGEHPIDLQIHSSNWTEFGEAVSVHGNQQDSFAAEMVKRRTSAPKKERRRTENINIAFAELRDCIPNVPSDTKLSKIKTLRLATSYISYLMNVLSSGSATEGFKAELQNCDNTDSKRKREIREVIKNEDKPEEYCREKKLKGRTGWPQQVWALELNP